MGAHLNYYDTALDPAGQLGRCVTLLLARYTGTRGQLGRCGARGRDRRANDPPPRSAGVAYALANFFRFLIVGNYN
jgi:hypothetical protein